MGELLIQSALVKRPEGPLWQAEPAKTVLSLPSAISATAVCMNELASPRQAEFEDRCM
jgi:hypothetical protein